MTIFSASSSLFLDPVRLILHAIFLNLIFLFFYIFSTEPNDESGANVDASVSINPKH